MNKEKLLKRMTLMVFFIFIINLLAMKFYWYSSLWYFDMFMHFAGGFWLGLAFLYLFNIRQNIFINIDKYSFNFFKFTLKIILSVLIVSILWEVFEILVNDATIQNVFNKLDTFSDICFDLAGGFSSIIYFSKKIVLTKENNI